MSIERIEELEGKLGILDKIVKLGWALIAGAFCLGVWATLLEIRTQASSQEINALKTEYGQISLWKAESNGNRYTTGDQAKYSAEIQSTINLHDKRVSRVEDAVVDLKKDASDLKAAIQRIEIKLGSNPSKQ